MMKIFIENIGCITLQQLEMLVNTIKEKNTNNNPIWVLEFDEDGYGDRDLFVTQSKSNITTNIPFDVK